MEQNQTMPNIDKVKTATRQNIETELNNLAEKIETKKLKEMENERKKGRSASYSLKAWSDHVKGLNQDGFITNEELETIRKIHENATNRFVKQSMGGW